MARPFDIIDTTDYVRGRDMNTLRWSKTQRWMHIKARAEVSLPKIGVMQALIQIRVNAQQDGLSTRPITH